MSNPITSPSLTSQELPAGNASVLALATMGLSGNKYMLGLMILLINLGARYIGNEVGDFMHKVLNHKFARRFLIFLVLWMGTRDLVVASVITIGFIGLVNTIFNENSSLCILPTMNNATIRSGNTHKRALNAIPAEIRKRCLEPNSSKKDSMTRYHRLKGSERTRIECLFFVNMR